MQRVYHIWQTLWPVTVTLCNLRTGHDALGYSQLQICLLSTHLIALARVCNLESNIFCLPLHLQPVAKFFNCRITQVSTWKFVMYNRIGATDHWLMRTDCSFKHQMVSPFGYLPSVTCFSVHHWHESLQMCNASMLSTGHSIEANARKALPNRWPARCSRWPIRGQSIATHHLFSASFAICFSRWSFLATVAKSSTCHCQLTTRFMCATWWAVPSVWWRKAFLGIFYDRLQVCFFGMFH